MPDPLEYRRTHSLLLLQRLLSLRPGASPFTLLLDSLEQSSRPLVREFIIRVKANRSTVLFLAFETLKAPPGVDTFIKGRRKEIKTIQREVSEATSKTQSTLLIIDTLHPLISLASSPTNPTHLSAILTSLSSHTTSILATYHTDIPLPSPVPSNFYTPSPPTLLNYLATTIITIHALSHALASHRAAARSLPSPSVGLEEGTEGILVGLGANGGIKGFEAASEGLEEPKRAGNGVVLELEHRRKSGRGVTEWFFLPTAPAKPGLTAPAKAILLDSHELFATPYVKEPGRVQGEEGEEDVGSTFSLDLTDKQRRDRAGVVLPYFDAQKVGGENSDGGPGDGGRILYQMGVEDAGDWDSEEDEL